MEIQLHHEDDTEKGLRAALEKGKEDILRHGLLSRDTEGNIRFGFVHGNWALDNSHPQGHYCGVSDELGVLKRTGCYADFTMPSAPDSTQTRMINSLYYAMDAPTPKSHDDGVPVRVRANGESVERIHRESEEHLLIVQGPLDLNWMRRKWRVLPRIENGDLTNNNPPTPDRMKIWINLEIQVDGQLQWVFLKLHTHGAIPENSEMLLGDKMHDFHSYLREQYSDSENWRLHYVTAREMVNIIHAAEDGMTGNPSEFRDYLYKR